MCHKCFKFIDISLKVHDCMKDNHYSDRHCDVESVKDQVVSGDGAVHAIDRFPFELESSGDLWVPNNEEGERTIAYLESFLPKRGMTKDELVEYMRQQFVYYAHEHMKFDSDEDGSIAMILEDLIKKATGEL